MDDAIWGAQTIAAAPQGPPLTFEKLKALHDYLKPENLMVAGEQIEIYGYHVHTGHCPDGFSVLTEKQDPSDPRPKHGKVVIINEKANQAFVYEVDSRSRPWI